MYQKGLKLDYLTLDKQLKIEHQEIDISQIFGIDPLSDTYNKLRMQEKNY
ncbi:MAG: HindVP family restriction endonuclease [Dolichospermum sp.]